MGERADLLADVLFELLPEFVGGLGVFDGDEHGDRLALELVRPADRGRLGHGGMGDKGRLDLDRRKPVARDVEHVVDAAHDPVVAVAVAACVVAGEVLALNFRPIDFLVTLVVSPDATQHAGPWVGDGEHAALVDADFLAALIDDLGDHPRQRLGAASRLGGDGAGQGRHHDAPRFGLPPRVDDRAALRTDLLVVPHPRLGIDSFADGAEDPQAAQIMFVDVVVAPLDERADRRGSRIEEGDLVLLDHLPESVLLGVIRRPLVHDARGAGREGAVHDVAVPGDPAAVGGAPVDVVVPVIEDPLEGLLRPQVVACGGVLDPLWFPGRTGRVEDEQRRLAVERGSGAVVARIVHEVVPPVVASFGPLDFGPDALGHHAMLDGGALGERLVDGGLERQRLAAPPAGVGREHGDRFGVVVPLGDRLGAEAREDDRVNRPDPRAGEHGDRQLGRHWHVDRDPVTLLDADRLEGVRELAYLLVELGVSERACVARLSLPEDGGLFAAAFVDVLVQAVV